LHVDKVKKVVLLSPKVGEIAPDSVDSEIEPLGDDEISDGGEDGGINDGNESVDGSVLPLVSEQVEKEKRGGISPLDPPTQLNLL
jgi:hypothetical protein